MKYSVSWLPEAIDELSEAREWYREIRPELAERFELAVDTTIGAILKGPLRFAVILGVRRRAGVPRFPHGIIYEVQDDQILVVSCFHSSRDPKRWVSRTS